MKNNSKYLAFLFAFTVAVYLSAITYFNFFPSKKPEVFTALFLYFYALTALIHFILVRAAGKRPQEFVSKFMLSLVIKLFLSLFIIVIYAFTHREQAVQFSLTFSVLYMLFTVFEVLVIMRHLKKTSVPPTDKTHPAD